MHLLTHSSLLRALGWSLLNSLWQMALLWLLYSVLMAVFNKASAHARHGLAVIFVGIGVAWSGLSFIANYYFSDGSPVSAPLLNGIFSTASPTGSSLEFSSGDPQGFTLVQTIRYVIDTVIPYCSSGYLSVLVFLFARYCRNYIHCRRLRTDGLTKIQPQFRVFVNETSRLMGVGKEVRIWLSSLVDSPLTLGFLRPIILIPFATVNYLSIPQVEAIILHELAHIRRNDYLLNLGMAAVEVLFFFNPFARLLIRDIRREREHCCDDLVIQFRYEPRAYIAALLSFAGQDRGKFRQADNSQQLAMAATGSDDRLLLQRVRRILDQPRPADLPRVRSIGFLCFALAIAFIAFFRPSLPIGSSAPRPTASDLPVKVSAASVSALSASAPATPSSIFVPTSSVSVIASASSDKTSAASTKASHSPGSASTFQITATASSSSTLTQSLTPASRLSLTVLPASPSTLEITKITYSSTTTSSAHPTASVRRMKGVQDATVLQIKGRSRAIEAMDSEDANVRGESESPDETAPPAGELAANIRIDNRAYSIGPNIAPPPAPTASEFEPDPPYVPNSSFTIRLRQDTIRPEIKLAHAQQLAAREVETAIRKMQQELQRQLQSIQATLRKSAFMSRNELDIQKMQQQILTEQLRLQQQYLQKQLELEKKLERTARRITIVYI
jgi:beta-lactamase regulating signal transducer with metallopeptidase domain